MIEPLNIDTDKNFILCEDPIQDLEDLVSIDSQSKNLKGIELAQWYVLNKLERIGFETTLIVNPQFESAPLLVGEKAGISHEYITFICHTDTVNFVVKHPFRIEKHENKIYGAGVADDKGGVIACLHSIKKFLNQKENHFYGIRVIVSPSEETGSLGFHEIFKRFGLDSKYLLGMEPADISGNIIKSRSGNRWYKLKVTGISAHAGRFGESHLNASHELMSYIYQLTHFNNEKNKTRLNFGALKSTNTTYNTICDEVSAKIDMRFDCDIKRDNMHERFLDVVSNPIHCCPYSHQTSRTFYSIEDDCPPLSANDANNQLAILMSEIISSVEGNECFAIHSGGAADINYLSHRYNAGIDGLGPIGEKMHTNQECIRIDSFFSRIEALRELHTVLDDRGEFPWDI